MSLRNLSISAMLVLSFAAVAAPSAQACPDLDEAGYVFYVGCFPASAGIGAQNGRAWVAACVANSVAVECGALNLYGTTCYSVYVYGYGIGGGHEVPVCA